MRNLSILLCVLFFGFSTRAQTTAAAYNFTATTGVFSSISATGTSVPTLAADDVTVTAIPIGFSFVFSGVSYTTLSACSNGWVSLNNASPTAIVSRTNTTANATTIGAGMLSVFWDDLDGSGFGSGIAGAFYYRTTGTAPNRVFTLEWNNFSEFFETEMATWQIKLYESSNIIEYWYGPGAITSASFGAATIGISNSATDYQTIPSPIAVPTPSSTTFTTSISATPPTGTVYRWYGCSVTASASNSGAVCPGGTVTLTGTTSGSSYSWSGPGGYSSAVLSPVIPGAAAGIYTLSATNGTCTTTATTNVTLLSAAPVPTVTPASASICNGGSLSLVATVPPTPGTILSQNFNSAIAPWTVTNTGTTSTSALAPWQLYPDGYTYTTTAETFHSPDNTQFAMTIADAGGSGSVTASKLTSPVFSLAGYSAASVSFQHYYNYWASGDVSANIEISTDGGTTWTVINNYISGLADAGAAAAFSTATFPLTSYLGSTNCRIRFNYQSTWGFYWALDNVAVTGTPTAATAPTWSPATYLFTDAAFTTPYVAGTPASTVYVHPTTVSSLTTVSYIATVSGSGCSSYDTGIVTINTGLSAITGPSSVCWGGTISLGNTTPSGTWSASNTTVATVSPTGIVTGLSVGIDTIYYNVTGCGAFQVVTVNPGPAISGPSNICVGNTISLTDPAGAGTWVSGTTSVATVTSAGVVTGVSIGSSIITFTATSTGCKDTAIVNTVNAAPIGGSLIVCYGGGVTTLTNTVTGGTWSSGNPTVATVNASTGAVYGVAAGTANITYTLPSGCFVTAAVTVNPPLAAITGPGTVCPGSTISLAHVTSGGTWTSGATGTATVSGAGTTGTVGGVAAGSAVITYATSVGCTVQRTITVNALPAAIDGATSVCANGAVIILTDASTPGTFGTAGPSSIATVTSGGLVTGVAAGSITVTYTAAGTGCSITAPITVNALPVAISGTTTTVCAAGSVITLTDGTPGGQWSSGDMSIATTDVASGAVYGVAAGIVPITYTVIATGCYISRSVTVLPIPAAITGAAAVCAGSTTPLADATTPGTWSVSAGGIATVSMAGVVRGLVAGNATVSYTGSNGCSATQVFTVNPLPTPIVGTVSVCQLAVTTLSSIPAGGTWVSGDVTKATVSSGGGVYGISGGTTPISYTTPAGCQTYTTVTVNNIPAAISGNDFVCFAGSTSLSDITAGGIWATSNAAIASINTSGVVYGIAAGIATISYITGANSCFATKLITVSPIAPPTVSITPSTGTTVCAGTPVTYVPTIVGGGTSPLYVWSVNNVILSGASSYTYTPADGDRVRVWILSSYACAVPDTSSAWLDMHVNPIVTPAVSIATGMGDTVCNTMLTTLTPTPVGGGTAPSYQWTVNGVPSGVSPTYTYSPSNGDVVNCIMTSNAPCRTANTATTTKVLTVSPLITPVVNISSAMGPVTCDGYPDILSTTMYGGGTAPTCQWTVNGLPAGVGPTYTYAPANGDLVQVTMISNFPCVTTASASANMSLTVLPITQPVGVITAQPGYIVPAGVNDTFTCTITSGGGIAPAYQWFINNVPQPGATSSVFIANFLHSGDSVSCAVTNTDQCSGVSVFSYLNITVGNNVGVYDLTRGSNVLLVPNPNNGTFRVTGNVAGVVDGTIGVQVTDMLGKAIYMSNAEVANGVVSHELQLDGTLANGTYLLTIRNGEESQTLHFTVQR